MQRFQFGLYIFLAFAQGFWFLVELSDMLGELPDFLVNSPISEMEDFAELMLFFASFLALIYLYSHQRKEKLQMQRLQQHLQQTQQSLDKVNLRLKQAGLAYHEAIKAQFLDWQLTKSEQEVALLLLKGLSFKEIAAVRQTQEKTVRQSGGGGPAE